MNYADILGWAERGILAEIARQTEMLDDARGLEAPSAPALRELLERNIAKLTEELKHVESLQKDPTGLGR